MKSAQVFLIDISEERKWNIIFVNTPAIIGRNEDCDIVLPYEGISGEHAKIMWDDDKLVCKDLGSTNGTRVNAVRIEQELLNDGEILSFGKQSFIAKIGEKSLPRLYLPDQERVVAIAMLPFTMGRSDQVQLMVDNDSVSKRHAAIDCEKGRYFIKDYKSTNGTRVNGQRIRIEKIKDGDEIQLGEWSAIYLEKNINRANYCLRILNGDRAGETIKIKEKLAIGRRPDNDLIIDETAISSHHAIVFWAQGHFWLKDLGSSNGTRIGGVRIDEAPIKHGDEISVATVSFLFYNKSLPNEKFYLVFLEGERGGEEIELQQARILIGRAASCDIHIPQSAMSKHHTEIIAHKKNFLIRDLKSTNGTFVNGKKIESAILQHGDQIEIGTQKWIFRSSVHARPQVISEAKFELLPVRKKKFGPAISLKEEHPVGRAADNALQIKFPDISSHHAVIFRQGSDYYIRDCKSLSGTIVNGKAISNERKLQHGDEIQFSRFKYVFKNSLRPIKKSTGVPYWFKGVMAAGVLFMLLSLFLMFSLNTQPVDVEKKIIVNEKKVEQQSDRELLASCRDQVQKLRNSYQYQQALTTLRKYQQKMAVVAYRQHLNKDIETVKAEHKLFTTLVGRLQQHIASDKLKIKLDGKGVCTLTAVNAQTLTVKPPLDKQFAMPWGNLTPEMLVVLIEQVNLHKLQPAPSKKFIMAHNGGKPVVDTQQSQLLAQKKLQQQQQQQQKKRQQQIKEERAKEIARQREREEFPLRLAMTEDFVRTYSYHQALKLLQQLEEELYAPDLKRQVQKRCSEIQIFANFFDRFIAAINTKKLFDNKVQFKQITGRLVKANREKFTVSLGGKGFFKSRWYTLPPKMLYSFYKKMPLTTREMFLVGKFCFENGLLHEGNHCFIQFLKKAPKRKPQVDKYLAKKLGIPIPEGGFVAHRGVLISKNERKQRLAGFVRYKGKWVTPKEKEKLASGLIRYKGKWVTPNAKKMLGRGYINYQKQWYTRAEINKLRSNWEHAWSLRTQHYDIRSNTSEEWTQELGQLMERAFVEYGKFFGKKVHVRMTLYAFRTYEDYRKYCLETQNDVHLRAGGFASSANNRGVGWMRQGKEGLFRTIVHEGTHLFHFNVAPGVPLPSWFAEATATQFEGYAWDGDDLSMDFVSRERLRWLQRCFLQEEYIAIKDMLYDTALGHINKSPQSAATFYAESWGLYYFLSREESGYQKQFNEFVTAMNRGSFAGHKQPFLKTFATDIDDIQAAWIKYILAMN